MIILNIIKAFIPYGIVWAYSKLRKKLKKKNDDIKKEAHSDQPNDVHIIHLMAFYDYPYNSYGLGGEDLLLRMYSDFEKKVDGFYIDIGAYHPEKASNTKYYYDKGWRGINIDPNPTSIVEFNKSRTRDINLEIGISDENGELDFFYFGDDHTINTFDKTQAKEFEQTFNLSIEKILKIPVKPINQVLEEHLPDGQHIDFISLDVEGFEMRILQSFDFEKYAPDYFLVEDLKSQGGRFGNLELEQLKMSEQNKFLEEKGYVPLGKTLLTILYRRE